jgi:hypothetical protein
MEQNTLILFVIFAIALIIETVLIVKAGARFTLGWSKEGGSLTIEGQQPPTKTNDCLPGGESSHRLN